jgi:hypothetical protein
MSQNNQYQIIWQKWMDPFGQDDTDNIDFDPYVGDYDTDDDDEEIKKETKNHSKAIRVIATPMGIIPMNDNTASNKIFNFWMGHTNFDITKHIADTIEQAIGVETLDVFTRYRFRIAIGKAFDDSEIMRHINTIVYRELENA